MKTSTIPKSAWPAAATTAEQPWRRMFPWVVFLFAMFTPLVLLSASAQTPPVEKKLDEIEKQIQALTQAVGELRRVPALSNAPPSDLASAAASSNRLASSSSSRRTNTNDPITRIRDEGLNRSQVMQTLSYLTDVIGPRLTGSPNLKRANEWTRGKLTGWGLTNGQLEAWGPFGRGWSLKRFSAQIVEPQTIPLIGWPKAWSPGFDQPLVAKVVHLEAKTEADLEKYKGKLKGAIVLASPARPVKARFDPLARRMAETNLLRLANASPPRTSTSARERSASNAGRRGVSATGEEAPAPPDPARSEPEAARPSGERSGAGTGRTNLFPGRVLSFVAKEGAALVVSPSAEGDGGTLFVSSATVPGFDGRGPNARTNAPRAWSTNAPAMPAQITLAIEDYNRLARMIQQGEELKMAVDLQVQFHDQDLMAYNTIAEIPGGDLKEEIVMLGGHMDSWHSGTGATDNGAGVAAAMEAARILQTLKLQPRRTIRIGLWSGEEQGLLGSKAYVSNHFGYYLNATNAATNLANANIARAPTSEAVSQTGGIENEPRPLASSGSSSDAVKTPEGSAKEDAQTESASTNSRPRRTLVRGREYEKLSAYFNLDNGTGKIRGVYMQGNEAVRPIFRHWLEPFADLEAETLTISNTGGTDHQSFDGIGLPGFQFIQDPIEYNSRTHHSNADVFDRIQGDDLKQAATIMAAFVYQAAMMDEKLPRKPAD